MRHNVGMRRNVGLFLVWILATVLAIAIASAAVAGVRNQVTARPASVGAPPEALAASDSSTTIQPTTTLTPMATSTTMATSEIEAPEHSTTTTRSPADATTTTTQTPSSSIPTTTTAPTEYSRTYDTEGGSVRIRVSGDDVEFVGAYPKSGWKVELENPGPEKVEIHFKHDGEEHESEIHEVEVEARIDDGELKVDISTE